MKIEKLAPAFKDYLWGGTKLRDVYGKKCDYDKIAESWELSTHPAGESSIAGGDNNGLKLSEYIKKYGVASIGKDAAAFSSFPVLIKFIDAKQALSIQVHPSDEYALRVEHEYGKTEMWYVMDCEPGSFLYFGVNREVTKDEFRRKIEDNTVVDILKKEEVHKGDVFFIKSGTIHAIGAGIMICEIQQNSNTTYRVYDYARKGADGKTRELHIDKAMDVASLVPSNTDNGRKSENSIPGGRYKELGSCNYFKSYKYTCDSSIEVEVDESSFASFIFLSGKGSISGKENTVDYKAGDSIFVPASSGKIKVTGKCEFIITRV